MCLAVYSYIAKMCCLRNTYSTFDTVRNSNFGYHHGVYACTVGRLWDASMSDCGNIRFTEVACIQHASFCLSMHHSVQSFETAMTKGLKSFAPIMCADDSRGHVFTSHREQEHSPRELEYLLLS